MTARNLEDRDLQHLRMLADQLARDAQALHDAIPADWPDTASASPIAPAIADVGGSIHQWYLFWEDAPLQDRLE